MSPAEYLQLFRHNPKKESDVCPCSGEAARLTNTGAFDLFCFFSLFLWGRCSGENLQVFQSSEIPQNGLMSSPSHLEERMASDLSSSHNLPSTHYSNLGTRSCSAVYWAQCPTSPNLSLPSCCLRHSPDPVQSCLSSLRQQNHSPDKKIVKWFRSGPGNHSEGRCKKAAAE